MTPAEAVAAINLALGPTWRAHFDSLTGELSARRGNYSVFGRSAGDVVDRAAALVVERVRREEAPRSLVVPVASPESTPVLIPSFVVVATPGVVKDGGK